VVQALKSLGITATRNKLNSDQRNRLTQVLAEHFIVGIRQLEHGCCTGGDEMAALLGKDLGYRVVAHPPKNKAFFSQKSYDASDEHLPELDYLERNRMIVSRVNLLVAVPGTVEEVVRSGTWTTLRYARERRLTRIIIFPDGKLKYDTA